MKYILLPFFVAAIALSCCTGCSLFSEPPDDNKTEEVQMIETGDAEETKAEDAELQRKDVANAGEWLYSEELDMEYPEFPTEAGFQIAVADGIKLPDKSLEELFVYEYHEVYEKYARGANKKHKTRADSMAELLLNNFFPGKHWAKEAVVQKNADEIDFLRGSQYHIKEKSRFEYWWYAEDGQFSGAKLICENGMIPVPEPEDGNWDQAFRKFSISLLDSFEIGLWDGESSHMDVGLAENVSGNSGCYEFRIALDGFLATRYHSMIYTDEYCPEESRNVCFRYQNGSLVYMSQWEHQKVFDAKRHLETAYENVEDAFKALQEGLKDYLVREPNYYCIKIESVDIEYIDMIGTYVPILTAHLKMGEFVEGAWRWDDRHGCSIQLESGNTVLMNSREVDWGGDLTGE